VLTFEEIGETFSIALPNAETEFPHHSGTTPATSGSSSGISLPRTSILMKVVDKEKGEETERGRPLARTPRQSNPLSRAGSRSYQNDTTIDVSIRSIAQRVSRSSTFFDDPTDPYAILEDDMLEPCPTPPIGESVSDMLKASALELQGQRNGSPTQIQPTWRGSDDFGDSPREEHLVSVLNSRSQISMLKEIKSTQQLPTPLPKTAHQPTSDTPLTNHICGPSTNSFLEYSQIVPLSNGSAASSLPAELIQQIYLYLAPVDFNSARHVSRAWLVTSLDRSLLEIMLRRGGWSSSMQSKLITNHALGSQLRVNYEWVISKHIARECALGPDWKGNGVSSKEDALHPEPLNPNTSFVQTSVTDLTELGVHYPSESEKGSGLIFTVSTCSRFLMVAYGCLVYIYELNQSHHIDGSEHCHCSGALRPITSVVCPRRALACSMDTSSGRYAIAILMEGRMGLVCALKGNFSLQRCPLPSTISQPLEFQTGPIFRETDTRNAVSFGASASTVYKHDSARLASHSPVNVADQDQLQPLDGHKIWQTMLQRDLTSASIVSASSSWPTRTTSFFTSMTDTAKCYESTQPTTTYAMHVEKSPPTLYHPLCSADDPPRSVALCPQRRCVAFGCSSGIELHWVDALTGQDLNRWFPLTAPSDFLYFLPPRAGIDSVKKLRLISSAGKPGDHAAIAERFKNPAYRRRRSGSRRSGNFWTVLGGKYSGSWMTVGGGAYDPAGGARDNSDHYRAVPLSDGYHILFTDPATGLLCLGSDAPIGGPTKLLRKIWFVGPDGKGSPVIYAAGSDLSWGVRIVAAYGEADNEQSIWLFCVPRDIFTDSMADQSVSSISFTGQSTGYAGGNSEWMKWWDSDEPKDWLDRAQSPGPSGAIRRGLWPVKVRGQEIGRCHGVVDVAIEAGPEMIVWAFGREGLAHTWQLDNGTLCKSAKRRFVVKDGTVREEDSGGDMEMLDVSSSLIPAAGTTKSHGPHNEAQEFLDGSFSGMLPRKRKRIEDDQDHSHNHDDQDSVPLIKSDDAYGDVLMGELPSVERRAVMDDVNNEETSWHDTIPLANYNGKNSAQSHKFVGRAYISRVAGDSDGTDLVEALTGIARIEIDIR